MVGLLFISRYASSLIRTPGITSLQRLSQIRKFGKSPLKSAIGLFIMQTALVINFGVIFNN